MLHQLSQQAVLARLESIQRVSKTAQLRRGGYRDFREPRVIRHWANR